MKTAQMDITSVNPLDTQSVCAGNNRVVVELRKIDLVPPQKMMMLSQHAIFTFCVHVHVTKTSALQTELAQKKSASSV